MNSEDSLLRPLNVPTSISEMGLLYKSKTKQWWKRNKKEKWNNAVRLLRPSNVPLTSLVRDIELRDLEWLWQSGDKKEKWTVWEAYWDLWMLQILFQEENYHKMTIKWNSEKAQTRTTKVFASYWDHQRDHSQVL